MVRCDFDFLVLWLLAQLVVASLQCYILICDLQGRCKWFNPVQKNDEDFEDDEEEEDREEPDEPEPEVSLVHP